MHLVRLAGLLPALLCAALSASGAKEVAQYSARVWQADEGLPLDAVKAVAQTPDGFIWVGTAGGLSRFDGTRLETFDSNNIPGMTSVNISGLYTTRDGSLWVATRGGGVHRLKNGRFTHYGRKEGLPGEDCLGSIFEDDTGAVWVGTLQGLSRFKNGAFSTITNRMVRDICQDLSGNIWLATASGIECWSHGRFVLHLGAQSGLPITEVRAICCWADGTIYVGAGAEVWRIEHGVVKDFVKWEGPDYNLVSALYRDRQGVFWAGTYAGLNRIVRGKFVAELSAEGLPYGTVVKILQDREDNLWVCAKDGLIRLKPNRVLCYTQQQGLASDNISSVLEDGRGCLRIATWGGGLNQLEDGVVSVFTNAGPYPRLGLSLGEDRAGRLWVGTDYNEGLYELEGRTVRRFARQNGLDIPAVRVIYEDRATNLWVGTSQGLYQMRDGRLERCGVEAGLADDAVRAICEDHEGNLWIGTQAGLIRLRDGVCTRFRASNGLASAFLLAVFEDSANTLWLGTLGGGLIRYHEGVFTAHARQSGLFSDNISEILEDDNHWLWMGSDRGIFRVSLKDIDDFDRGHVTRLRCVTYGKTDGMVNNICNSIAKPGAWKSRDGRLWFATIKGLCVIDPKKEVLAEAPPPPVVIEELLTERDHVTDQERLAAPIRLGPGRTQLEFRYAALAFRAPEENRYRYKLHGVDSGWVEAGNRQTAHYNNIYPGKYRFQVIACNSDGVWNEAGATLAVMILPHFWQTWWFRPALVASMVGGLAAGARTVVTRRREIAWLRSRIAADLHDEIGSNLASIALLSELAPKRTENGGSSELSEIHRIALSTVNSIRELVWFINPDYDTLAEMIARMKEVAAQMLAGKTYTFESPEKLAEEKLSLEFRRNLFLIFKEILHNVVKHANAAHVQITLHERQGALILRVADDGKGFDPSAPSRGNGLRNMRLRAKQIGGTVEIERGKDGGLNVTVSAEVT